MAVTMYYVYNEMGYRDATSDAAEAQRYSEIGYRVTAVTEGF